MGKLLKIRRKRRWTKQRDYGASKPLKFLPDGRIAISLANTADMPVTVTISPPLLGDGKINMIVPKGEMKLSLVSPAQRGVPL